MRAAPSPQPELQHQVCNPCTMSLPYCRDTKKYRFLFVSQPAIMKYDLSPMEGVVITARDGLELPAYLSLPVGKWKQLKVAQYVFESHCIFACLLMGCLLIPCRVG